MNAISWCFRYTNCEDIMKDICEDIMREILYEKFKQSETCKQVLIDTGNRRLFEGTGDRQWVCGIPISKAHLISFENPGKNLMGRMLEEVRRDLKPK